MAEFYAVYTPYEDAARKMRRHVFLKQLKENPSSIDWRDFKNWAWGWNIGTKEQEDLAAEDPTYRALRENFFEKKEMMKKAQALTWMRSEVHEKHTGEFFPLEDKLLRDLKALQSEMDKLMSNTPVEQTR
jgi:hypothetical protein